MSTLKKLFSVFDDVVLGRTKLVYPVRQEQKLLSLLPSIKAI